MKEKRQQIVRARKYYEDYRVQLRAKMMRARTREERVSTRCLSCFSSVEFFSIGWTLVLRTGVIVVEVMVQVDREQVKRTEFRSPD